jgi:methionyl-tRNA formyltransferase
MLVCIAGKNSGAVDSAEYILRNLGELEICVLPNRDDPGYDTWQPSLRKWARISGVREVQIGDLYALRELVFVSVEYDRIINPDLFSTKSLYNIHYSLLPEYKGAYCSIWPILDGKDYAGLTLHVIDHGIDTGDVIYQSRFVVSNQCTSRELYAIFLRESCEIFKEYIQKLVAGDFSRAPQVAAGSSFRSRKSIDFGNLKLDLKQTAESIRNQVRAFSFPEYQLAKIHGFQIRQAEVLSSRSLARPGASIREDRDSITIASIDYDLLCWKDEFSMLLRACEVGDVAGVEYFGCRVKDLEFRSPQGWTALIVAAYNGQLKAVKILSDLGASVETSNYKGTSPLMYAMAATARTGDFDHMQTIIDLGASIDSADLTGRTALAYSQQNDWPAISQFLIKNGARNTH